MRARLLAILVLGALVAGPAAGQDAKPQDPNKAKAIAVDQAAVDRAIENGLKFLKTSDSPKGAGLPDSDELPPIRPTMPSGRNAPRPSSRRPTRSRSWPCALKRSTE